MRVLLLGSERPSLEGYLTGVGDEVTRTDAPLLAASLVANKYDFLVSYGYRHLIRQDWLWAMPSQIVNLHISYLPWNRGSDPNLWSFVDDTPKGVSIHFVDGGLDTGPLVARRKVFPEPGDTLASSYARLSAAVEDLFRESWPAIRAGSVTPVPQPPGGSCHRLKDRERVAHLLTRGWDTPVEKLMKSFRILTEKPNA
ncbi:Formyl transferase domain protein [Candidatus Methylomirabilis oxygeniifera]|uniref:phosphoribosylglycinamide formyltransferase 1 n=1 Tax=Methylomirabilis oxygeniifera TaxID=671143 RepID=D5MGG3_METO1|nr:Formyl transferase domain protein [Candidatus Methylomirabilis oxyfera]